jgi:ABC-type nitrate/sulfonate/bicarbonate transport system permease component
MKKHGLLAFNSVIVLLSLLGLWQLVVSLNHLPAYILPGPFVVAQALRERLSSLLSSL